MSSLRGLYNDNANKRDGRHYVEKINDNVLMTEYQYKGPMLQRVFFDYMTRTVAILVQGSNHDRTMTFDEMDPDVLKLHREILIELGGHPQPLPDTLGKARLSPRPATTP